VFKAITMRSGPAPHRAGRLQQETVLDTERALIHAGGDLRQQKNCSHGARAAPESFDTTGASLAKLRFPRVDGRAVVKLLLGAGRTSRAEAKLASQGILGAAGAGASSRRSR